MGADERPWFGKKCAKCEAPLNYAQASKGIIVGLCGKCTDEARRAIKDETRHELANENAVVLSRGGVGGGGGAAKLVAGVVVGLVLGLGGAVGLAAFAPAVWGQLVGAVAPEKKSDGDKKR